MIFYGSLFVIIKSYLTLIISVGACQSQNRSEKTETEPISRILYGKIFSRFFPCSEGANKHEAKRSDEMAIIVVHHGYDDTTDPNPFPPWSRHRLNEEKPKLNKIDDVSFVVVDANAGRSSLARSSRFFARSYHSTNVQDPSHKISKAIIW